MFLFNTLCFLHFFLFTKGFKLDKDFHRDVFANQCEPLK